MTLAMIYRNETKVPQLTKFHLVIRCMLGILTPNPNVVNKCLLFRERLLNGFKVSE